MRRITYAKAVHGKEEFDAVADVLNKSETIMGHRVKAFEEKIARLFAKRHGIMVNSGSSANFLAFEVINLPKGSEVITPVMTFTTTVSPIVQHGLIPVFTDVEEGTYLLNIDQLEELISDKTRALMVPSLLGNIPDYPRLYELAKKNNLILIEDSCDTLGATIGNESTGKYSDISTTSFYGSHIITAAGEGGMICVNKDDWDRDCRVVRGWGRSSAADEVEDLEKRFQNTLDGEPHDAKFIFERLGYNFLPSEIGAAFGLEQLKKLEKFTAIRRKNFTELKEFFSRYESYFILPKQRENVQTSWMQFPLTIREDAPFTRTEIVIYLEKNGVQTRPAFSGNLLRHPAFKNIRCRTLPEGYPVADVIMRQSFLIGCHHGMIREDLDYMKGLFKKFFKEKKLLNA